MCVCDLHAACTSMHSMYVLFAIPNFFFRLVAVVVLPPPLVDLNSGRVIGSSCIHPSRHTRFVIPLSYIGWTHSRHAHAAHGRRPSRNVGAVRLTAQPISACCACVRGTVEPLASASKLEHGQTGDYVQTVGTARSSVFDDEGTMICP